MISTERTRRIGLRPRGNAAPLQWLQWSRLTHSAVVIWGNGWCKSAGSDYCQTGENQQNRTAAARWSAVPLNCGLACRGGGSVTAPSDRCVQVCGDGRCESALSGQSH